MFFTLQTQGSYRDTRMAVYAPLNLQSKEIRLFLLYPGSGDEPIRGSLHVVSLHGGPTYEALSYVWGSRDPSTFIQLNGQPFQVTPNLQAALKRLRLVDSRRTLWVDAICINQADDAEKAVQVVMMGDIYANTSEALLWLGEEPDVPVPTVTPAQSQEVDSLILITDKFLADLVSSLDSWQGTDIGPIAADLPRSIQAAPPDPIPDTFLITHTRPHTWYGDERDMPAMSNITPTTPDPTTDSILDAFRLFRLLAEDRHQHTIPYLTLEPHDRQTHLTHAQRAAHWLMTRTWWSRIWIVQECILPRRGCSLLYGPVSMPWDVLLTGLANFQRHRDSSCCAAVPGVRDMLNLPMATASELHMLRTAPPDADDSDSLQRVSLAQLLLAFRHRQATDPRDKVYSLLRLVTEWHGAAPVVADYGKSVEEVYTDTVVKIIRDSGCLDVLCRLPEWVEDRLDGLPSWVMDLSQKAGTSGAALERVQGMLPLYDSCGKLAVQGVEVYGLDDSTGLGGGKVLAMKGVKVDVLKRASTIMVGMSESLMGDTVKWWYGVAEEEVGKGDAEWRGKFARTMCGDSMVVPGAAGRSAGWRRANEEDVHRVERWVERIRESPLTAAGTDNDDESGAVSHTIQAATQMRAFVTSRDRRMGLVPNMARLTFPRPDEIFLFPGGKAPIILRDVGVRDIPGVGPKVCHEFLGECYLHGVMDGEGMGMMREREQMVYIV